MECGADSAVGIGLADRSHEPTKFPGWKKKSCGYHSDDGILYKKGHHNKGMLNLNFHNKCLMVRCGVGVILAPRI